MDKHPIAISANKIQVYAFLNEGRLGQLIARNPHLLTLLQEVIQSLDLESKTLLKIDHDMGRPIGYSEQLATEETDSIFYARQLGDAMYTRFVKNRSTERSSILSFDLHQDKEGSYELKMAQIGSHFPQFSDIDSDDVSKQYWATHAIVFNGQPIVSNTITKLCPY